MHCSSDCWTLQSLLHSSVHTAHLCNSYRESSMRKLTVAYNNGRRLMHKLPWWSSAIQMFVSVGVPICCAILCNLMHSCMCRVKDSRNSIITSLTDPALSSVYSKLWNHWRYSICVILWICFTFSFLFYAFCMYLFFLLWTCVCL